MPRNVLCSALIGALFYLNIGCASCSLLDGIVSHENNARQIAESQAELNKQFGQEIVQVAAEFNVRPALLSGIGGIKEHMVVENQTPERRWTYQSCSTNSDCEYCQNMASAQCPGGTCSTCKDSECRSGGCYWGIDPDTEKSFFGSSLPQICRQLTTNHPCPARIVPTSKDSDSPSQKSEDEGEKNVKGQALDTQVAAVQDVDPDAALQEVQQQDGGDDQAKHSEDSQKKDAPNLDNGANQGQQPEEGAVNAPRQDEGAQGEQEQAASQDEPKHEDSDDQAQHAENPPAQDAQKFINGTDQEQVLDTAGSQEVPKHEDGDDQAQHTEDTSAQAIQDMSKPTNGADQGQEQPQEGTAAADAPKHDEGTQDEQEQQALDAAAVQDAPMLADGAFHAGSPPAQPAQDALGRIDSDSADQDANLAAQGPPPQGSSATIDDPPGPAGDSDPTAQDGAPGPGRAGGVDGDSGQPSSRPGEEPEGGGASVARFEDRSAAEPLQGQSSGIPADKPDDSEYRGLSQGGPADDGNSSAGWNGAAFAAGGGNNGGGLDRAGSAGVGASSRDGQGGGGGRPPASLWAEEVKQPF
jgi:hypothetical protein